MVEGKERLRKIIFDKRFGSLRHLSGRDDRVNYVTHAVKKEAVELLLASLDCLNDVMTAGSKGKEIDGTAISAIQQRLQGMVRMQRLLAISEAERPDTGSHVAHREETEASR